MESQTLVRNAAPADLASVAQMMFALWPGGALADHESHARAIVEGPAPSTLPLTLFVAERDMRVVGFIEAGLRSHADSCDALQPVGYIEGWFVEPEHRGAGIGAALMRAAEDWARQQGCKEIASDTWSDNQGSIDAHTALGYEVTGTSVNFKKSL